MNQFTEEIQDNYRFQTYKLECNEEIDTVTYGMITNNKIDGIIDCSYIQIDNERIFRFNVTEFVCFQSYFQKEVKKKELLSICYSLAKVIQELNSYMIDNNRIILDQEYMYVNTKTNETNIIVLPVESDKEPVSLHEFLKALLFEAEIDQEEDITYLATLIKLLGNNFNLDEFIRKLNELKNDEHPINQKEDKQNKRRMEVESPRKPVEEKQPVVEAKQEVKKQVPPENVNLKVPDFETPMEQPVQTSVKKKGLFANLFKKEEKQKSKDRPKKTKHKKESKSVHKKENFAIPGMETSNSEVGQEQIPFPNSQKLTHSGHIIESTTNSDIQYSSTDFGSTVVLEEEDETTILGDNNDGLNYPYLINKKTLDRINIDNMYFRIGKKEDNNYVIYGNKTISKYHASIEVENNQYYIIDNNSTNYTFINQQKLIPQKKYPLQDGDILKLSNELFEFHC